MSELAAIRKQLDEILRTQSQHGKLLAEMLRPRRSWVGPGKIKEITGWDDNDMYRARENKTIQFKKGPGGGYLYDINSLSNLLIKSN